MTWGAAALISVKVEQNLRLALLSAYIAVAEWLVRNDRWPDAETKAALSRADKTREAA